MGLALQIQQMEVRLTNAYAWMVGLNLPLLHRNLNVFSLLRQCSRAGLAGLKKPFTALAVAPALTVIVAECNFPHRVGSSRHQRRIQRNCPF
ncbi:hypothetical protein EMIT0196MI5_130064 [Pseudomonas sp. IT-196MI5]